MRPAACPTMLPAMRDRTSEAKRLALGFPTEEIGRREVFT